MFSRLSHIVAVIAATTLALVGFGCSSNTEFRKAVTPIATIVVSDMSNYTAAMPDGNSKITETLVTKKFEAAVSAADRDACFTVWSGEGLRGYYVNHLKSDPKYASGLGVDVLDMKLKNVDVLDYVFDISASK